MAILYWGLTGSKQNRPDPALTTWHRQQLGDFENQRESLTFHKHERSLRSCAERTLNLNQQCGAAHQNTAYKLPEMYAAKTTSSL